MMEHTQSHLQLVKKVRFNTISILTAHALHEPITGAIFTKVATITTFVTMMT